MKQSVWTVAAALVLMAALAALPTQQSASLAVGTEGPGLVLILATEAPEYSAGAAVTFTVAVDNRGDAPVTIVFPSAQVFDITAYSEQRDVWRWSANKSFPAGI